MFVCTQTRRARFTRIADLSGSVTECSSFFELTKIDVGFLEAKTPQQGDPGVFDSCSERRTLFDASGTGTASIAFDDVVRCCAVAGMSL
jgi:hypothetical protein